MGRKAIRAGLGLCSISLENGSPGRVSWAMIQSVFFEAMSPKHRGRKSCRNWFWILPGKNVLNCFNDVGGGQGKGVKSLSP